MKQGPRYGLHSTIAGKEGILADPPGGSDGFFQERQDDMTATEYERAGAVEGIRSA